MIRLNENKQKLYENDYRHTDMKLEKEVDL